MTFLVVLFLFLFSFVTQVEAKICITNENCTALQIAPLYSNVNGVCCNSVCIDPRINECCGKGSPCESRSQKCCSADLNLCCKTFTEKCASVDRIDNGTLSFCSSLEYMATDVGMKVVALPVIFTFFTVVGLLVSLLSCKSNFGSFDLTEKATVFLSIIVCLCSIMIYFSPAYTFGVIGAVIACVNITCIGAKRLLAFICLGSNIVFLLYFVGPFNSNSLLSFNSIGGIFNAVQVPCSSFYNFFQYDTKRFPTPDVTGLNPDIKYFGFCSREWLSNLMFWAILSICCCCFNVVFFILSAFAEEKPVTPASGLQERLL